MTSHRALVTAPLREPYEPGSARTAAAERATMPSRAEWRGAALVLAAAVLWGTTGTARALAGPGADPLTVGAVRLAVGGLALLAVATLRRALGGLKAWRWPAIAVAGLCMAAYQPLFFAGVARTGVAVGTVVGIGSAPVVAGLLGTVVRREWPDGRWFAATALAVLGCGVLVSRGQRLTVDPLGVLLAVGAGTAYAVYAVSSKGLVERHDADGVTAAVFVLAALLLSPALLLGELRWLAQVRGLAVALHLGLVATAAAYFLFNRGLARVPVGSAATLSLAEPATATVLGVAVLGERLDPASWMGIGAIAAGLAVLVGLPSVRRRSRPVGSGELRLSG